MKYIIGILSSLILSANSQFNFEINGNGFRFGILGSEVINIGGGNAGQPVKDSNFPLDQINQITNVINPPLPPRHFTTVVNHPMPPQPNIQTDSGFKGANVPAWGNNRGGMGNMPIPPFPPAPQKQIKPNQVKKDEGKKQETTKKQQNIPQVEQQIQQQKQNKSQIKQQIIKIKPVQEIIAPELKKNAKIEPKILDVSIEKLKQQQQFQLIRRKQDQKLLSAIKQMPNEEKQHLRSIITAKTQN